jgi:MoaA/NifB/PqqE/SkfB family radical SAM enzyme
MSIKKDTFCVAPWYSIYVDSSGRLAPCCKFGKKLHNYNHIQKYFESPELEQVRQDLLNGVKNANCDRCWKDEDNGADSLRLISNRTIGPNTNRPIMEQIKEPKLSDLKSFDLTLGNLCNLKCVMCNPGLSSQLLAEANLNPALKNRYSKNYIQKDFDWPKGDDFVDWCNDHLPQAIHIKFTGGEPFIIPWIQTVLDKIPEEQKKKCILHFTTNLTIINLGLFENFSKFKEVWLSVSVEGIQETHEYLRYGHKWETLETNIRLIQEMKIPNLIFKVNHVVQTPSYHSIIPMTEYFDDLNMDIHPILLKSPKHHHISALTRGTKENFLADTAEYKGRNNNFINFVRSVSELHMEQDTNLTKLCIEDLSRLDRVRNNNFRKIIPEQNLRLC